VRGNLLWSNEIAFRPGGSAEADIKFAMPIFIAGFGFLLNASSIAHVDHKEFLIKKLILYQLL